MKFSKEDLGDMRRFREGGMGYQEIADALNALDREREEEITRSDVFYHLNKPEDEEDLDEDIVEEPEDEENGSALVHAQPSQEDVEDYEEPEEIEEDNDDFCECGGELAHTQFEGIFVCLECGQLYNDE